MNQSTLLLAYGNPLRGDDGVGWHVGERLEAEWATISERRVILAHQLTPEMAEAVSQAKMVFFVDAATNETVESGIAKEIATETATATERRTVPGAVTCRRLETAVAESLSNALPSAQATTHHVGPSDLLETAYLLYGERPEAYLVTITGSSFDFCENLSPAVAEAVEEVCALIAAYSSTQRIHQQRNEHFHA